MAELSEKTFQFLKKRAPIKFLATLGEDGYPNLVPVLSTIAWDKETLCFVRFMIWKTRRNLEERRMVAVSGLGLWQAVEVLGEFAGFEKSGERLDFFNNQTIYRYNAYMGAGQVGVIKVVAEKAWYPASFWRNFQARMLGFTESRSDHQPEVMNAVVLEKFQRRLSTKYFSWLDQEGHPRLAPAPGAFPISPSRLGIFSLDQVFRGLEIGSPVAVSVLSSEPNAYQVKGRFAGKKDRYGISHHLIELEKSFACGPPRPGERIYPGAPENFEQA